MSFMRRLVLPAASLLCGACFLDAVGVGSDEASGGEGGASSAPVTSSATTGGGFPMGGANPGGGGDGGGAPPPCGNDQVDPGEECDGDPDCTGDCTIDPGSVCYGAPSLGMGTTTVTIDGSSPASFGTFASFDGSCGGGAVADALPAAILRYEIPAPHPEGVFISATTSNGFRPVVWAYRGCGADPIDCASDDGYAGIRVRVQPSGNVFYIGTAEASGAHETIDLYTRPYRYFDSFAQDPIDWTLAGDWVWNQVGATVDLATGAGDTLSSSDILIADLASVWVGIGYQTGNNGGATIEVAYDGGGFTALGELVEDQGGTWRDLTATPPAGAQHLRVRIVGVPPISIGAVMVGPVVPL